MGFEEALRHEADDWLPNLADNQEGSWLNTNTEPAEDEPSPLTSTATDTRVASGSIFKGYNCPAPREFYDGWPRLDAELKIPRCMKTCVYCGKDWQMYASSENIFDESPAREILPSYLMWAKAVT